MTENMKKPQVIFEVSWEVCNNISGINTVIASKAQKLVEKYGDQLVLIGPDVYRESSETSEFMEDPNLFDQWRMEAGGEGLHVRIGRWNIPGQPVVVLVDFTTFFSKKDEIFGKLWETHQLDSLAGQWDYIEPALFGYATGKVIESFARFNFNLNTSMVAHFHEWTSGAGMLYLKNEAPNIATVFTTHSTVIGRTLVDNGIRFYGELNKYKANEVARENGVVSKQSLEIISTQVADAFTAVSGITAMESQQFLNKKVDMLTPYGFNGDFVPAENGYEAKRKAARNQLLEVASAVTGEAIDKDAMLLLNSGRYRYEHKGIDVLIDALDKTGKSGKLAKQTVAFIMVPANSYGPRKELIEKLNGKSTDQLADNYVTHSLHDKEFDPILKKLKEIEFTNSADSKLKLIFVPAKLHGNDGVFNMDYFELLPGFDLTVFPSYYEPWGYASLESLAMSIPSVVSGLTGLGSWIKEHQEISNNGVYVLDRLNNDVATVIDHIVEIVSDFSKKTNEEIAEAKKSAKHISTYTLWDNILPKYDEAYHIALSKLDDRQDAISEIKPREQESGRIKPAAVDKPIWRKAMVLASVPEKFLGLNDIAKNLWWSWNYEAGEMFEYLGGKLWRDSRYNPISLLEMLPYERFVQLEKDKEFVAMYQSVLAKFKDYMETPIPAGAKSLAYFSMEYGFHDSVKIFSGGLGILAGDYLKEASDSNVDMVGVGLLYRQGYFKQVITIKGEQIATYENQQFLHLPLKPANDKEGNAIKVSVYLPGRTVFVKVWELAVGRIRLYLLDTDIDDNSDADRGITYQLYGGDNENRLKQEMILGVGGIRALNALGENPHLYHCNEGHAAFIGLERLNNFINKDNYTFSESTEIVRASTLFTTHTPVPAGHDSFNEDLIRTYMSHYPQRLNISWEDFLALGKINVGDRNENFSMSHLAMNLSQEVNGVSWLHGEVSKEMFNGMYPGYYPNELHISYVTNGVHYPSWTSKSWQELYNKNFGEDFIHNQIDTDRWEKIYEVPNEEIWKIRQSSRKVLIDYVRERVERNWIRRHEDPHKLMGVLNSLNENNLVIGFARRFATYKRAKLLFNNLDRLASIVNNQTRPVVFLFAGKAHPNDKPGQELIKDIIEISRMPQFLGKILFLENYDIELAKKLVQGVDIWLNTPTRPLEASGTSGMKSVMNGGLHFSVLDGWWVEGYEDKAGWALPMEKTYEDQALQNQLDAEMIYNILEQEVQPLFYMRNSRNVPDGWVEYIKNSIAHVVPKFTMKRMLVDYEEGFYGKLFDRTKEMRKGHYKMAMDVAQWKKRVARHWEEVEVVESKFPASGTGLMKQGSKNKIEVTLRIPGLEAKDISLEMVFAGYNEKGQEQVDKRKPFDVVKQEGDLAYYEIEFQTQHAGITKYGIRMFPSCECLPHRQDFNFVRWI